MLTTLRIRNLALAADLTLELQPGYNVITGETGAGKSMLIGGLNLVLGERAERNMIRSGADSCSVEAVFDVGNLKAPLRRFLEENGLEPCEDGQLVLKRTLTSAGTNRQFVNGSPTTLSVLGTIGEWLVDIHGPHEHQSLLHPAAQLAILDAFGKLEPEREGFSELVRRRAGLEAQKAALVVDEQTYAQQLDLLGFQVKEISAARLQPDEDKAVEEEYRRGSNSAKLLQLVQAALDVLSENETSLLNQTGVVGRFLSELQRLDPAAAPLLGAHEQATGAFRELQGELSRYAERIDLEPARLAELEERLNLLQSLKRKYGSTIAEVIQFGAEAQRKVESLKQRDAELGRLNSELAKLEQELWRAGAALSAKRAKVIPALCKVVGKQLADLGFKQSRFDVEMRTLHRDAAGVEGSPASSSEAAQGENRARLSPSGLDTIEFQFAPNPGEPMRPLRAIASSGELARVMLALKTVLAAEDQIPVLIFDEVDANIGGETANAVGEKMLQVSRKRQVLCITHLPQVAAPASAHFLATKQLKAGRTVSEVKLLNESERVTELARMLGGQSEASRKHAQELLSLQGT